MKKLGWTMIGAAMGAVCTVSLVSRAQAQEGTLALFGDAPKNAQSGASWTFSFKDSKTGRVVAERQGKVSVENGRYLAEVDRRDLSPGKVYSVSVKGEEGEELAMVTFVTLQASTPGVVESGNINVSGTILATTKIGVGTGSMPYLLNARTATSTGGTFSQSGGNGVRGVSTASLGSFAGGSFNGSSPEGYGVFGINSADNGTAYGGYFKTSSPRGVAVHGDTLNIGGEDLGTRKIGVRGTARLPNEFADGSVGVLGEAFNQFALDYYGVLGVANPTTSGWGVFSSGDSGATGTKSFLIDDPRDPENAYIRHYCSESSEPLLTYSGTAKLDASGAARVNLPSYWSTINTNPRYQLTAVGAPMPNLYIAAKVQNNQFSIAGGKANGEVTWTVIGTRNDPFVKRSGIQAEVKKPRSARGKYLEPSLYGQPNTKSSLPIQTTDPKIDPQ